MGAPARSPWRSCRRIRRRARRRSVRRRGAHCAAGHPSSRRDDRQLAAWICSGVWRRDSSTLPNRIGCRCSQGDASGPMTTPPRRSGRPRGGRVARERVAASAASSSTLYGWQTQQGWMRFASATAFDRNTLLAAWLRQLWQRQRVCGSSVALRIPNRPTTRQTETAVGTSAATLAEVPPTSAAAPPPRPSKRNRRRPTMVMYPSVVAVPEMPLAPGASPPLLVHVGIPINRPRRVHCGRSVPSGSPARSPRVTPRNVLQDHYSQLSAADLRDS